MVPNETPSDSSRWSREDEIIADEKNFELFFKQNFLRYCFYCQYKFGFDIDDAKEAVHLGFVKLWERRQSIGKEQPVAAYLQKIIHNNCLDFLKHEKVKLKYKNSRPAQPEYDDTHTFSNVDVKLLEANIREAIAALPPQMKKIFEMSRFDGLGHAEIARRMNLSKKTVETQIGRAINKLKQKLEVFINTGLLLLIAIKYIFFILM
jgi:RNA polymerase sigma-70 factor (ECF subfamily)